MKFLITALLSAIVQGHSWIDCIDHDRSKIYDQSASWVFGGSAGNGFCEGYARNYPGRGDSDINRAYTYQLSQGQVQSGSPVCQYDKSSGGYNGWRTMVNARPGERIYFGYMPNGHVSKDKMGRTTKHGIYWSGDANSDLTQTTQLNADTLVEGSLSNFDDGNCGETFEDGTFAGGNVPSGRAGNGKPCIGSFVVPAQASAGTYQFVWFWTFYDTDDNQVIQSGFFGAAYTSCFDVVVSGYGESPSVPIPNPVMKKVPEVLPIEPLIDRIPTEENTDFSVEQVLITDAPKEIFPEPEAPVVKEPEVVEPEVVEPEVVEPEVVEPEVVEPEVVEPEVVEPEVLEPEVVPEPKVVPEAEALTPTMLPVKCVTKKHIATDAPMYGPAKPMVAQNPLSEIEAAVTVNSVGGSGSYGKVVGMAPGIFGQSCPTNQCVQQDYKVSGSLAPFNEDVAIAFRGPMQIHNIGVYEPSGDAWNQVSSYKEGGASENLQFMNNKGDGKHSGEWTSCGGNSASYATSDGKDAASSPSAFNGKLDDTTEVHVTTGSKCGDSCGFHRGEGYHGWKGSADGSKMFIVKATMPHEGSVDIPAIWMLNAQVVRTAQYGCNCRGIGTDGQWKGGCGEFDVAEVLTANKNALTSTLYTFKGARGAGEYADRPSDAAATFVVIFDASGKGVIKVVMLSGEAVNFEGSISNGAVQDWLQVSGTDVDFNI